MPGNKDGWSATVEVESLADGTFAPVVVLKFEGGDRTSDKRVLIEGTFTDRESAVAAGNEAIAEMPMGDAPRT